MINVIVTQWDHCFYSPIIRALQRAQLPIALTGLVSYRNGMEYRNIKGQVWTLTANQYVMLKNGFVGTYTLRYEGESHLTLKKFEERLDMLDKMREGKHHGAMDWHTYLNVFFDEDL